MSTRKVVHHETLFNRELEDAVREGDAVTCGRLAEKLRIHGWKYADIFGRAHRLTGITMPEWDALMQEADHEESQR